MRKIFVILLAAVLMNIRVYGNDSCYGEYKDPEINYNIVNANVKVNYNNKINENTVFCNGRLSIPLIEGVKIMGGELKSTARGYKILMGDKSVSLSSAITSNRPVIFTYNNVEYISIYELITPFGYEMLADLDENSVNIIEEACENDEKIYTDVNSESKKAYIRLEDIVADGLKPESKGNYTVDMLEKLKYTAEYLYKRNQEYYIAWIPVYVYPKGEYLNDVSKDYNLYNSYFLYVIDYMTDHKGHLGLHGYTHQYGDYESGIGYEWGENTPYNINEQLIRMIEAKNVCRKLGYKDEFFEFPHYGATKSQMLMAENYFDAVYQSYYDKKYYNYITYTTRSGKKVYYIPTPADYVHYKRDDSIFERIKNCVDNNYTLSLFYHPVIDEEKFEVETKNGKRVWSYSEEGSLPRIVNYIIDEGYSFSKFN